MSAGYRAVRWNPQKRAYDGVLAVAVLAYLAVFVAMGAVLYRDATAETLLIRALGTAAFILLHVILCIGPLCRLQPQFLPLLYNRRHLGVTLFLLALAHASLSVVQFHAFGDADVLASVLSANPRIDSVSQFPFQPFGLAALAILFVMAATSHDFWLANLTPPVWKALHMGVYVAYALLILHVALGALQSERSPVYATAVAVGLLLVLGLHRAAARQERAVDEAPVPPADGDGFVAVCRVEEIPERRARITTLGGERIAVFRYDGQVSAVSNLCAHQNGPLGEGEIVDGCITCPWHGFQYDPATGRAPAPFRDRVATYRVRMSDGIVYVHPEPSPPGAPRPTAATQPPRSRRHPPDRPHRPADTGPEAVIDDGFYIGHADRAPPGHARRLRGISIGSFVIAVALAALLASQQASFVPSVFELGTQHELTGWLREAPAPRLLVAVPGARGQAFALSSYLLVSPGKAGARDAVRGLDGRHVRVRGTLVHLDGETMLELSGPDAVVPLSTGRAAPTGSRERLGRLTLRGEIVDSKCHFGVMNPGTGKVHRACAARCLSGGIPPVLLARRDDGGRLHLLITGEDGRAIGRELIPRVAEPIEVTGDVERIDGLLVLRAEPDAFVRVP